MAAYQVACVNEAKRPLSGVTVEAVSLNSWPTVSATATTGREGVVTFTGLSGPHWFRPRVRRTSVTVGGRTYTGMVEVQVIALGEGMNVDYVVDTDGMGTHTTLALAVADAITDAGVGGSKTIWLCKSVTESDIDIGGLGTSANITIASHSQQTVVITANASEDIFKQESNGGNIGGGLHFRNVGFSVPTSNYAIYNQNAASGMVFLRFENCDFDGEYIARQDGNDSLGVLGIEVRDCTGSLAGFYDVAGASGTYGPDELRLYGCSLALTDLWDGGSASAAPDRTFIGSSRLELTNGVTFGNTVTEQHFQDLFILFAAGSALFTTGATMQSCQDFSFQNIVVRFADASGTFCNLGSNNINPGNGLFFDGIYGYPAAGVGAGGTFITVDTDWANVYVGDIYGKDFSTQYSGPTGVGPDHGLLVGLGDDDHTQYLLLAGRSGGQAAIGGTDSGDDLTLESTSHGTKGSVQIVSGSTFEVDDANYALALVSSNPRITFDANDYQEYNRSSNYVSWVIGSTEYMRLNATKLDLLNSVYLDAADVQLLVVAKSGAYTLTADDGLVLADASGGIFTLTLPTAVGITGRVYRVKKTDATANVVTIDANAAETIDEGATATLLVQYEAITVVSDGTEWWVL